MKVKKKIKNENENEMKGKSNEMKRMNAHGRAQGGEQVPQKLYIKISKTPDRPPLRLLLVILNFEIHVFTHMKILSGRENRTNGIL